MIALATSGVWAGFVWTGAGDGYWNNLNYNTSGDTGATGMFFRSGVNDTSGNEIVVVNNDVHFNGKKTFNYNFYVDRGTSLAVPATLAADTDAYGITVNSGLNVGTTSSFGDGYLWIKNGTYSFNVVNLGQSAANPASSGYLTIGSPDRTTTFTSKGNLVIHNGEVTIEKVTVSVNGNLKMNDTSGSTATFYNRGGNLVVTNDLYVQDRGSGEFYMEGGHVTVSNMVRFGEYYLSSSNKANLYLNGGVFEAKAFRFHNCDSSTGSVIFNGGTYKAMAHGSVAVNEGRMGYDYLYFRIGERGATIDTAGYDVVFPLRLLQDGDSTGGLCVKGGGSLTLENKNVTYAGKTFVEAGTTLVISNSTVKSNILSHGLELVGAPTVGTPYVVFRCNDTLTEDDLANVTCGVASDFAKVVGEDGKSIVVTVTTLKSAYWTGAKDGNLSDPANWSDGVVPTSGNPVICCPAAATLTVGDTFCADTITIPEDSSVVTIGAGDLHLGGSLTNAMKLAVARGASLTVDGDLVLYKKSGTALYANEGTVLVKGDVVFLVVASSNSTYYQYEAVTDSTTPIMAGGLAYNG